MGFITPNTHTLCKQDTWHANAHIKEHNINRKCLHTELQSREVDVCYKIYMEENDIMSVSNHITNFLSYNMIKQFNADLIETDTEYSPKFKGNDLF